MNIINAGTQIIAGLLIVEAIIGLAVYILMATAFFKMFRKANVPHAWLAYVPIAQYWPFFWTIKKSAWNILWGLVSIAGIGIAIPMMIQHRITIAIGIVILFSIVPIVLGIIWQVRLFKAFGMNPWWLLALIGGIIPIINYVVDIGMIILFCYMGFSSSVHYNPNFNQKGGPTDGSDVPM